MIKLVRAEPQNVIGYHFCDYVMLYDKREAYHLVLVVKNLPANTGNKEDLISQFDIWVGKIPRRRAWQPTPVFLP